MDHAFLIKEDDLKQLKAVGSWELTIDGRLVMFFYQGKGNSSRNDKQGEFPCEFPGCGHTPFLTHRRLAVHQTKMHKGWTPPSLNTNSATVHGPNGGDNYKCYQKNCPHPQPFINKTALAGHLRHIHGIKTFNKYKKKYGII